MEILNIKNLTFQYPQSTDKVLHNINLSINEGDFVLLCGASGSGKTTLLRLLVSEIAPFGKIDGEIYSPENITKAIVTQDVENQIVSDTVWHNLAFQLENMNKFPNEIRHKVAEVAEFFDIAHLFHKNTDSLSGGEKQLVNLASSLISDPDILILDEPTSQLDPIAARKFTDTLKRLNEEMGLTIIISEHRCEDLWNYASNVYIMNNGNLTSFNNSLISDYIDIPKGILLYEKLGKIGDCPLTVKECKNYLSQNFKNNIKEISNPIVSADISFEFKNVYFRYEKNNPDILNNLSLKIKKGEILTLLGGNGSGKTTLLSLISGINKPYCGRISNYSNRIAILPQNIKSVFTKDILHDDFELISNQYIQIAEELSVNHLLNSNPYDLSGGEAQRAALAKILLLNPDVLCLDEPTKGIDPKGKKDIQKILKNLANKGVSILIVSHDADFTAEISDRCAFLFDGQIVSEGTPCEIFSKNKFYTTFASRISRHMYKNTVTIDNIVELCKRNGYY